MRKRRHFFRSLDLDAAVVAAYGLILPAEILQAPKRGCLNIHASLLPRWRGAAPIQAAILAGDAETGITIMQMDEGLDTGAMLLGEATPIGPQDTAADLHDRLAEIGGRLILRALDERPVPVPQDEALSTYAPKLSREDARLNFTRPAVELERQIRAYTPWPGSLALLGDIVLKILAAELVPGKAGGRPRRDSGRQAHHRLRRGGAAADQAAAGRQGGDERGGFPARLFAPRRRALLLMGAAPQLDRLGPGSGV